MEERVLEIEKKMKEREKERRGGRERIFGGYCTRSMLSVHLHRHQSECEEKKENEEVKKIGGRKKQKKKGGEGEGEKEKMNRQYVQRKERMRGSESGTVVDFRFTSHHFTSQSITLSFSFFPLSFSPRRAEKERKNKRTRKNQEKTHTPRKKVCLTQRM